MRSTDVVLVTGPGRSLTDVRALLLGRGRRSLRVHVVWPTTDGTSNHDRRELAQLRSELAAHGVANTVSQTHADRAQTFGLRLAKSLDAVLVHDDVLAASRTGR